MRLKRFFQKDLIEAGCDEVGRGCLAGPVVAAAVILPKSFRNRGLNDSKQLTARKREQLSSWIKKKSLAYGIAQVSHEEIDHINILNASYKAMHLAIDKLSTVPEFLIIDGNRFKPFKELDYQCIVKGDSKYASIAAASILAKTYRDALMKGLATKFPVYSWETNMGYPTAKHREGIRKYGVSPYHRRSFQLLPNQLELFDNQS